MSLSVSHRLPVSPLRVTDFKAGLAVLHRMGWVHRDISAGNILVLRDQSGADSERALRGLLMDFEYAQPTVLEDRNSHKARTVGADASVIHLPI